MRCWHWFGLLYGLKKKIRNAYEAKNKEIDLVTFGVVGLYYGNGYLFVTGMVGGILQQTNRIRNCYAVGRAMLAPTF